MNCLIQKLLAEMPREVNNGCTKKATKRIFRNRAVKLSLRITKVMLIPKPMQDYLLVDPLFQGSTKLEEAL